MLYSVITIMAMLTCQSAGGHVCQKVKSVWESLDIYLFIVSHLNIIISRQTSRYSVGYLAIKFTKEFLEN